MSAGDHHWNSIMSVGTNNQELGRNNYYETTVQRPQWPRLGTGRHADVAVVGAGLAGLSCALELAEQGRSVIVLESGQVCGHASGRNGGQVIAGFACGQGALERKLGPDSAREVWDLSLLSIARMRQRIDQYAIDCHPVWSYLHVADRPHKARLLQAEAQHMNTHYGHALKYIEGAALREHLGTRRYVAGLLDPLSGHVNPLRWGLGLARAAQSMGVEIFEHSPVRHLKRSSDGWILDCEHASVRAEKVFLAGNCGLLWESPQLAQPLHARIMPVGTYIIATEPLGEDLARHILPSHAAVCDNNFVLDYFRLSADSRLLFGGRVSYTTATPMRLQESMRARMVQIFPQLSRVAVHHTWGGFVDITRERAPDWGQLEPGLFYAQGFSGHGLAATTLAGMVISQAMMGDAHHLQLFERIEQGAFPGGSAWRLPLLLLGTGYFRLKEFLRMD
jgi:gamma-glutamylputrescine oxidase